MSSADNEWLASVGSIEPVTQNMWVFNDETKKMESRKITYVSELRLDCAVALCRLNCAPMTNAFIVYGRFYIYLGAWPLQDI